MLSEDDVSDQVFVSDHPVLVLVLVNHSQLLGREGLAQAGEDMLQVLSTNLATPLRIQSRPEQLNQLQLLHLLLRISLDWCEFVLR